MFKFTVIKGIRIKNQDNIILQALLDFFQNARKFVLSTMSEVIFATTTKYE